MRMFPVLPVHKEDDVNSVVSYKYHHGNVKSVEFDVKFISQFKVVLNALDNVDARRHVNRLCLAADVPLVEAGTTGYLGQTTVICKQVTECYECQPKPTQKVYPICTIRSTPSQPVHCIVWAKELFALMFYHGEPNDKSMLYEDASNVGEESTYMDIVVTNRPSTSSTSNNKLLQEYANKSIQALYVAEIQKQIDMDKYKTSKHAPQPLNSDVIRTACEQANELSPSLKNDKNSYLRTPWTIEECVAQVVTCIQQLYGTEQGCEKLRSGMLEFDKDDTIAMQFVTATANLRAHIFGIELSSLHDAKGIAGNIIPAIATTNAIVAGLQILEVFKILQISNSKSNSNLNQISEQCRYIYCLRDKTRKGYYLQPTRLPEPCSDCFVCRKSSISLVIDTEECTLQQMIDKVFRKALGFNAPTIMIDSSAIYEEGEGADDDFLQNLPKLLYALPCGGIKDGVTFTVEDFTQDMEVDIIVTHRPNSEWDEKKNPDRFIIQGEAPQTSASTDATNTTSSSNASIERSNNDGDDDVVVCEEEIEQVPNSNKRKLDTYHANGNSNDNDKVLSGKKSKHEDQTDKKECAIVVE